MLIVKEPLNFWTDLEYLFLKERGIFADHFFFLRTPWKFNPFEIFAFEISFKSFKRKFVLKRKGLTPAGIRKFKISFEKIANLLSKFYCKSIVLTTSYPTSGRCPYFAFWEACKKIVCFLESFRRFLTHFPKCEIWTSTTRWIALREYNRFVIKFW